MKYEISKAYTDTFVCVVDTQEEVMKYVERKANKFNFGLYRYWTIEDVDYYDCGPTVYKVQKVLC